MNTKMTVPDRHKRQIAISTLRMSDTGAKIMGGMTKDEARDFLKSIGWLDEKLLLLEKETSK